MKRTTLEQLKPGDKIMFTVEATVEDVFIHAEQATVTGFLPLMGYGTYDDGGSPRLLAELFTEATPNTLVFRTETAQ